LFFARIRERGPKNETSFIFRQAPYIQYVACGGRSAARIGFKPF